MRIRHGTGPLLLFSALALSSIMSAATDAPAPAAGRLRVPAGFSGVVLVARGPRLLVFDALGKAGERRIRQNDRFWIASTGKQFVAAAIMKLVEQRKLGLSEPLTRFFSDVPSDKATITVKELLSHTSGLAQSYVSEQQMDRAAAVARMLAEPLAGRPGSTFRYSNSNIQLAAAIVEVVSGSPYSEFVNTHLWEPAGLRHTGFAGTRGAAAVVPIEGELPPRLRHSYWGEQGVYSTAGDLFRWYRALTNEGVLRPESRATMFTPATNIEEGQAALGWFVGKTARGSKYRFVRGNEDFGANSVLYAYPKQRIVIVALTHAGHAPDGTSWSREVQQSLERQLAL